MPLHWGRSGVDNPPIIIQSLLKVVRRFKVIFLFLLDVKLTSVLHKACVGPEQTVTVSFWKLQSAFLQVTHFHAHTSLLCFTIVISPDFTRLLFSIIVIQLYSYTHVAEPCPIPQDWSSLVGPRLAFPIWWFQGCGITMNHARPTRITTESPKEMCTARWSNEAQSTAVSQQRTGEPLRRQNFGALDVCWMVNHGKFM